MIHIGLMYIQTVIILFNIAKVFMVHEIFLTTRGTLHTLGMFILMEFKKSKLALQNKRLLRWLNPCVYIRETVSLFLQTSFTSFQSIFLEFRAFRGYTS